MASIDWIAVDWGTSHVRAWAMSAEGPLHAASSTRGMSSLAPGQFEDALLELIDGWLSADRVLDVLACGMAGARQGWCEAPYGAVPCAPLDATRMVQPVLRDPRIRVSIIPGLCQNAPADVMRGEETQIAGWLAERPGFEGVICLPGTHSKWAEVRAGQVMGFQTFMTGELFALLLNGSVLRHGLQDEGEPTLDGEAFIAAVRAGIDQPQQLLGALFALRAEGLLQGLAPSSARARLSGGLIGHELAAVRRLWQSREVCIIGDSGLADLYSRALQSQGVGAIAASVERVTLAGLAAARAQRIERG